MSAIIEYMWVKIYIDESGVEHFIPQFREDGTQQFWTDSENITPTKLLIVPISPKLAENMIQKKIPAASVPLTPYTFLLKPSDKVTAYWDNEITITNHFECETCGFTWQHTDASKWAECPRCGEKDTWSCMRCGASNINNTLVKKNNRGETNCPYCEIPYGLNRSIHLHRIQDIIENTDYVILVENRFKVIIRQHEVCVESL
jgi:DNA-directed RNA polymerase subunit RPC12/RpoP